MTYDWQQTWCTISLHTSYSLPLSLETQNPNVNFHACKLCLVSLWIDGFLCLFWTLSPHTGACTGASAPMLCEGQSCCACVGAVLVVFATHLHFYVLAWRWLFLLLESPLGFRYILCVVALLCLLENSSICPFRKRTTHSCLSAALLRKYQCPFPLSISVYLCPRQRGPEVDIKCLCRLIIHDHLNKLQNAPWHFYWRQSTADGTNVFLSGTIMTIKVSSGTWNQCLMTRLRPVSAAETSEDSSVFYELIVLSRWAAERTGHGHWCIAAVWNA